MADATLATIYAAIKDLAYTSRSVADQDNINTFPRIIIQEILSVPAQHINGILPLKENTLMLSIYGLDTDVLETLEASVVNAVMALDQIFHDGTDSSIEDRGDGNTLVVYRKTLNFTFYTGGI